MYQLIGEIFMTIRTKVQRPTILHSDRTSSGATQVSILSETAAGAME
jgi:hypothetical protein